MFCGIFAAMLLYFVYFNVFESSDVINSPYNRRQDTFAERVVRGEIRSSDGDILAQTDVASDGTETRVYPYGEIFAHVVGYESEGKSGIESLANFSLLTSHAFFTEKVVNELQEQKNIGDNVYTSLNTTLQTVAYEALGSYDGAVVVLEPSTGKILAMVSKPGFDPNTLSEDWDELISSQNGELLNRATQGQYPPGSVFKIVTALEYYRQNGSFDGFSYDCEGSITHDGYTISCYNGTVHGAEDFRTAFAKSCNAAFASMGLILDRASFTETCESLLFNTDLPISFPYNKSKFSLDDSTEDTVAMMTAMGQGETTVSPMHIAMITAAVANGGVLMNPYVIERVESYTGTVVENYSPSSYGKLMSAQEAEALTGLMEAVVSEGTGRALNGASYTVAGKTGTAEFSSDKSQSHAWFTGFSNIESPDIVVTVIVEEEGSGSEYAVPIAKKIFDAYYGL